MEGIEEDEEELHRHQQIPSVICPAFELTPTFSTYSSSAPPKAKLQAYLELNIPLPFYAL